MTPYFTINPQIGRVKHSISFHNGIDTHNDGSPRESIKTFKNAKEKEQYRKELLNNQYTEK